jgi:hypothetical protein
MCVSFNIFRDIFRALREVAVYKINANWTVWAKSYFISNHKKGCDIKGTNIHPQGKPVWKKFQVPKLFAVCVKYLTENKKLWCYKEGTIIYQNAGYIYQCVLNCFTEASVPRFGDDVSQNTQYVISGALGELASPGPFCKGGEKTVFVFW